MTNESTKSPAEVLVKARDAAMTVCVGFSEEGEDVYVGPNTAEAIATAVLNATAALGLFEAGTELQAARRAHKLNPSAESLSRVRAASHAFDAALKATAQQEGR